jgi:GT2 family glycosyltransferase
MDEVQVVINSYGRETWYVERAINSVLRQKHPPSLVHLIDQNPAPLTLDPRLLADPRLRIHHYPTKPCARARNLALKLVPSGWIAFADDDSEWAPGYSELLSATLAGRPDLGLIAGSMLDEDTGDYHTPRHRLGGDLGGFFGSHLLYGANFAIRADVFARIGGYDERLGPGTPCACSEETDLCWRVITASIPALYLRELSVRHPSVHSPDKSASLEKARRYARGKGALAAIWTFEKHHRFGLLEYIEMTLVPPLKALRGVLRGDFFQLIIQPVSWCARQWSFWSFPFRRPVPPS